MVIACFSSRNQIIIMYAIMIEGFAKSKLLYLPFGKSRFIAGKEGSFKMLKGKKIKVIIVSMMIIFLALGLGYHMYCHKKVSEFYKAMDEGDTEKIIACVNRMPNINMMDICIPLGYVRFVCFQGAAEKGYPMDYAIWKRADVSVIEALLKKGADPNRKHPYGSNRTSFQDMCHYESADKAAKIELMVQYGADVSTVSPSIPAYFQDLGKERKEEVFACVSFLWENGAADRMDVGFKYERTVLHEASECLDVEYLSRLYHNEKRKMDYLLNERNASGRTPLFSAVQGNNPENCRFLMSEGVEFDVRDNDGRTAYDLAVELGHGECAEILKSKAR